MGQKDNYILRYHIKNKGNISLDDFSNALKSIQQEYYSFVTKCGYDSDVAQLYVKEVEKGSIIVDMEVLATALIPFIENINTVFEFGKYLNSLWKWIKTPEDNPAPKGFNNLNTLNNIDKINNINKNSQSDSSFFIIKGNNNVVNNINLQYKDATDIQKNIREIMSEIKNKEDSFDVKTKVILRVTQLNNQKTTGDKGIIEAFCKKDRKLIFDNDDDKIKFTEHDENPFEIFFVVDAMAMYSNDKLIAYKITKVHEQFLDD